MVITNKQNPVKFFTQIKIIALGIFSPVENVLLKGNILLEK